MSAIHKKKLLTVVNKVHAINDPCNLCPNLGSHVKRSYYSAPTKLLRNFVSKIN